MKKHLLFKIILSVLFFFLLNCTSFKKEEKEKKEEKWFGKQLYWKKIVDDKLTIIKIEEKKSYFIIYVTNRGDVFKVISMKNHSKVEKCRELKLDRVYKFRIEPIFQDKESGGLFIDNEPVMRKEGDSIENLYSTDYLKGLCIQSDKK